MPSSQPFIRTEEKSSIFLDRAAQGASELIHDEGRLGGIEVAAGIERAVAMKFIDVSVQLIGSRLGDHVHDRTGVAAIFGIKCISQNAEFFYAVGTRLDSGQVGEHVIRVAAIHAEIVGAATATVHGNTAHVAAAEIEVGASLRGNARLQG